jgi:uncharacterized protein (TIGR02246 family)
VAAVRWAAATDLQREGFAVKLWSFLAVLCLAAMPAFAGPAADATAHSEAFARAVNARDEESVLALYADDARVIWPGQGEEAKGRADIATLISKSLKDLPKDAKMTLKSQAAIPLGDGYIATVGRWEESFTDPDGKRQIVPVRTTEIIKKQGGKTLYIVDHASVGLPPADAPASPGPAGTEPRPLTRGR